MLDATSEPEGWEILFSEPYIYRLVLQFQNILYLFLDDRDYRDRNRDRDSDRGGRDDKSGGHGASSNTPSNSLFAEMLKKKKNRALLESKKRDNTSVIVNTELSDPRPQSVQVSVSQMNEL